MMSIGSEMQRGMECDRRDDGKNVATIRVHLEDGPRPVAVSSSLADLVAQLGHAEKAVSTAINGQFVPRSQRAQTLLREGDQVLIFQAIVGG